MAVFQKNNNYWIDYYVNGRQNRHKPKLTTNNENIDISNTLNYNDLECS